MILVVAAVLLAACGDDGAPSSATETTAASLPDTFPVEFPIYDGATLIRAGDLDGRYIAEWRVIDATSDVADYYLVALATDPWSVQIESAEGEVMQIEFVGDEQAPFVGSLAVAPIPDTTDTRVVLSLVER